MRTENLAPPKHHFYNVKRCARCGQDHEPIEFHGFVGNPIEDQDGTIWNQWGFCPTTGDPILLRIYEEPEAAT